MWNWIQWLSDLRVRDDSWRGHHCSAFGSSFGWFRYLFQIFTSRHKHPESLVLRVLARFLQASSFLSSIRLCLATGMLLIECCPIVWLDADSSWSNYPGVSCPASTVILVNQVFISPTSDSLRSSSCNLFVTQYTPTLTPYTISGKLNVKAVPAFVKRCVTPKEAFSNTT